MSGKVIDVNILLKFIRAKIEPDDVVGRVWILCIQNAFMLNFELGFSQRQLIGRSQQATGAYVIVAKD